MLPGILPTSRRTSSSKSNLRSDHDDKSDIHSFPFVLPFSQMYPLCCIDIRNFVNQIYFFSNDDFQHPEVIDETLKMVCRSCATLSNSL